ATAGITAANSLCSAAPSVASTGAAVSYVAVVVSFDGTGSTAVEVTPDSLLSGLLCSQRSSSSGDNGSPVITNDAMVGAIILAEAEYHHSVANTRVSSVFQINPRNRICSRIHSGSRTLFAGTATSSDNNHEWYSGSIPLIVVARQRRAYSACSVTSPPPGIRR